MKVHFSHLRVTDTITHGKDQVTDNGEMNEGSYNWLSARLNASPALDNGPFRSGSCNQ